MSYKLKRHKNNPIIIPDGDGFRKCASFNPGVIIKNDKFYLYERAAESLRPFNCSIGLHISEDGVNFKLAKEEPILRAEDLGYPFGTIEDPRIVEIDSIYYMTYAYRPYTYKCFPTGYQLPDYEPLVGELDKGINNTVSGIAISKDLINFEPIASIGGKNGYDERDSILFPEKINGKFAMLRRPKNGIGKKYGIDKPSIWISYSDDLIHWTEPKIVAKPKFDWEGGKIGGGAPPLRTDKGWLLIYHGVNKNHKYCIGAMILDIEDPTKVIARSKEPILSPEEYYEKVGLVIPNVIFPTGNVIKDGKLYVYYGCCDTCIALATAQVDELISYLMS